MAKKAKSTKVVRRNPSGQKKNMAKKAKSGKDLPIEMILEVLKRFPVRDVVQFRCLSKQLCREIDSAGFAKAHLSQSKKTRSHRKFVCASPICSPGIFMKDFVPLENPLLCCKSIWRDPSELPKDGSFIFPEDTSFKCVREIYGSCNGLILLSSCGNDHDSCEEEGFLWLLNPSTRRCKKIESCPCNDKDKASSLLGFGYDSIRDDYKIVQISMTEIWVYSFASNTWRNRKLEVTFNRKGCRDKIGAFADGALHWFLPCKNNKNMIVSFHLSEDKFVNLIHSLPFTRLPKDICLYSLQSLQGYGESQLVLVQPCMLRIAVKGEEGDNYSWRDFHKLDMATYTRLLERPEESGQPLLMVTTTKFSGAFLVFRHSKVNPTATGPRSRTSVFGKAATFCWESLVWPRQEYEQ